MDNKKQNQKFVAAMIFLIIASFILTNKLLSGSSELSLVMNGTTMVLERPEKLFTYSDLLLSTFSSFVLGTTIMYLLSGRGRISPEPEASGSEAVGEDKTEKWRTVMDALKDDEQKVYKEILEAGGEMFQKDLVVLSGLNGPKVTRILDNLEKRDFVERRSYGMTNKVRLK